MITITKEDLIGQIANFPLKIVEAVVQPDKFNEGTTGASTSTLVSRESSEEVKTSLKYGE